MFQSNVELVLGDTVRNSEVLVSGEPMLGVQQIEIQPVTSTFKNDLLTATITIVLPKVSRAYNLSSEEN